MNENKKCGRCGSGLLILIAGRPHCNSCGADGDVAPDNIGVNCCPDAFVQMVGGITRCGACGRQSGGTTEGRSRFGGVVERRGWPKPKEQ